MLRLEYLGRSVWIDGFKIENDSTVSITIGGREVYLVGARRFTAIEFSEACRIYDNGIRIGPRMQTSMIQ